MLESRISILNDKRNRLASWRDEIVEITETEQQ